MIWLLSRVSDEVVLPIIAQVRRPFNATLFIRRIRTRTHGFWSHSNLNLVVCIAPAEHAALAKLGPDDQITLTLVSGVDRSYIIREAGISQKGVLDTEVFLQDVPAVTLIACGTGQPTRLVVQAVYTDT